MESDSDVLFRELADFINGSAAGFLQLLVAAARRSTFERIINCPTYPVPAKSSGLSSASKRFREAAEHDDIHLPTFLAKLYSSIRTLEHRKYAGQFFTSRSVAEWALSRNKPTPSDHVCDAGAGTAVFAGAIIQNGLQVKSYTGVEAEPILALCSAHVLDRMNAPPSFRIWYANFLLLSEPDYDSLNIPLPTFVISNPPFVRFHNLKGRGRVRKELKMTLDLTLSSLSGSANYFVSRAAHLAGLARRDCGPRGRMLFFLPREAEGAVHSKRLWDDLGRLHGWTRIGLDIPQGQTGIDRHRSNALAVLCVFEKANPVRVSSGGPDSKLSLGDLIRVRRGISTGCNDFFVLTDNEVRERGLPRGYLKRILPTRISLPGQRVTKADWDILRKSEHRCWLLALPPRNIEEFEPAVQDYLKEGMRRGVHSTPTAESLRSWFSIPVPPDPPDLFVTYLFRGAPRFLVNEARLFNLTNILGGRFLASILSPEDQDLIAATLNRNAPNWIERKLAGREYKGGLMKIEPGEFSSLPIDNALVRFVSTKAGSLTTMSPLLFGGV